MLSTPNDSNSQECNIFGHMKKLWKWLSARWKLLIYLLLGFIAADLILTASFFFLVNRFIEKQPDTFDADVGVVFYGESNDRHPYLLGPRSIARALMGWELYRTNQVDQIICVGAAPRNGGTSGSCLMRDFLIENQVDPEKIYCDSTSYNTITNWREAQKIMDEQNLETAVLISSPLHIYRIGLMIDKPGIYFATYHYEIKTFRDLAMLYFGVHREFTSHFLSIVLPDDTRNRLVKKIRSKD